MVRTSTQIPTTPPTTHTICRFPLTFLLPHCAENEKEKLSLTGATFRSRSRSAGSALRIAIVHARWNTPIIEALVAGARKAMIVAGVTEENIIIQSVPGSYELPFAVQRFD